MLQKPLRQCHREVLNLSLRSPQWQSKGRARGLMSPCRVSFQSTLRLPRELLPPALVLSGGCHHEQTKDCFVATPEGSPSIPNLPVVVLEARLHCCASVACKRP